MKLNKSRRVLGKLAILIMLVLLLAFLVGVAPVSSAPVCRERCGPTQKEILSTQQDCKPAKKVGTILQNGQVKTLYKQQCRDCQIGDYYRMCQAMAYCKNTKTCAPSGSPQKTITGAFKKCGPYRWVYFTA